MSVSTFFKNAWTDMVKAEHAVVAALEKAAAAVPEVEAAAEEYGPEIAQAASALVPNAGKYTNTAIQAALVVGQMIEQGGSAAEKQFLDAGADNSFLTDIKNLWNNLKTAAGTSSTPAPAPSAFPPATPPPAVLPKLG